MPIGSSVSSPAKVFNRRAFLGIGLVVAAMILVAVAIYLAGKMESYYTVKHDVVAGQNLDAENLVEMEANPGIASEYYLKSEAKIEKNLIATQNIRAGELVPKSCISTVDPNLKRLVIPLLRPLPDGIKSGTRLEIWKLPDSKNTGILEAENFPQISQRITMQAVLLNANQSQKGLSQSSDFAAEIYIPAEELPELLVAVGVKAPLVAIPVAS